MNLEKFIERHRLPAAFVESAEQCYFPYAKWLETQLASKPNETYVLGINGAQGTGKSTLADLVCEYLSHNYARTSVVLSLDDIYLTKAERERLGEEVHPLLRTRGVPGTHDVSLGLAVIEKLRNQQEGDSIAVPRFDKAQDDRCPTNEWPSIDGPVDLVIFEGWCVGSQPQAQAELATPINRLESEEDANGDWRTYVNDQLNNEYTALFGQMDSLLFLQVPNFDAVLRWRTEQETKLRDKVGKGAEGVMSDEQVARFIQHYERITRHNLAVLPSKADRVISLDDDHQATYPST